MASLVGGLGRFLQPVLSSVLELRGPAVWYGLLSLRLLALFSAESSWRAIRTDFVCDGNLTQFCHALCFNHAFSFPTASLWSFSFLAVAVAIALLQVASRGKIRSGPQDSGEGGAGKPERPNPCPLLFFLLLLLLIETSFLWVLIAINSSIITPDTVSCQTSASFCPRVEVQCVVLGRSDKQMAMVTLGFTSTVNILASVGYTVYLLVGPSRRRRHR
ncbi:uncharacterized protein [Lepisosteus oculatus]|uniref:uncharacterized protein n=1 Tax=Lepisosteus oculatus TaxID=7918 RepID=UPI003713D089